MPFRQFPEWLTQAPLWVQWSVGFIMVLASAGIGAMARIADDVKKGHREKFWTKKLFLEVPAVGMMVLIGWGTAEYFNLGVGATSAVTAFLGWGGPKVVEALVAYWFPSTRGK